MITFSTSSVLEWWTLCPCFNDYQKPVKPATKYTCLWVFIYYIHVYIYTYVIKKVILNPLKSIIVKTLQEYKQRGKTE